MKNNTSLQLNDPALLKTDSYIDGNWVKGKSRFIVTNPANGHKLADVANLGVDETNAAVSSA